LPWLKISIANRYVDLHNMYDGLHTAIAGEIAADAWVLRFSELTGGRNADEKIAGHRGHRHGLAAAPGIRRALVARID
jgi:hypothetical protein